MATYYVATTGNNGNNGSIGSPWLTLQYAVDQAAPGDIIQIRTGSAYAGATLDVADSGGAPASPVIIENYPGEAVTVTGVTGSRRNVIWFTGTSYVTLRRNAAGGSFTVREAQGTDVSAADAPACIRLDDASAITIDGLVILRPGTGTWGNGDAKGGFGVYAEDSQLIVQNCDISRCGSGVRVLRVTGTTYIQDNEIHHCDRMLNNSGSSDTGAQGVAVRETARAGAWTYVRRNYIHDCIARSVEFGFDGGGIELFKASNVEISDNDVADTKVFSESGTGSGRYTDAGPFHYLRNRVWRKVGGATGTEHGSTDTMAGINMRSGTDNIVAHNSFYRMNNWGCILVNHSANGSGFTGPINRAKVFNNANTGSIHFMQINSEPTDLTIDYNISDPGSTWGKYLGTGKTSLAAWQSSTPYDDHSIDDDVEYTSTGEPPNFALQATSPAINAGMVLAPYTDGYVAPAPDMGAVEFGVADPGGDPGSGTIYSTDAFGDTASSGWGNDDQGGAWAVIEGTASNFSVSGGLARRSNMTGASNAALVSRALAQTPVEAKAKMRFTQVTTSALAQQGIILRHNGTTTAYRALCRIQTNGDVDLRIESWVAGTATQLAETLDVDSLADGTAWMWVRFQVSGTSPTTLKARLWRDGNAEPAAWQLSITDSTAGLQVSGGAGVRAFLAAGYSGATNEWQVDDWEAKDLGATVAVTSYIAGSAAGDGNVVVGATTGTTVPEVYDYFDRDVEPGGWGNTTSGHVYTVTPTAPFSVVFGQGIMAASASPNNDLIAELRSVSMTDSRLQGNFRKDKLAAGASQQFGMRFRAQANGDFYRAVVRHKTDNILYVNITERVGGVSTDLATDTSTGFTVTDTTALISLKAEIQGTTIRVKAWPQTDPEPVAWQLSVTDSSITAPGFMALTAFFTTGTSNFPVTVLWEDVFAGSLLQISPAYIVGHGKPRGRVVATRTSNLVAYIDGSSRPHGNVVVGTVAGTAELTVPLVAVTLGGTNITARIKAPQGQNIIRYGRGANFDGAADAPGYAVITVANADRAFNPLNASSPLASVLKLGKSVHLSAIVNSVAYHLFHGFLRRVVPLDNGFAELHCADALFNYSRRSANVAASVSRSVRQFRETALNDIGETAARRDLDVANGGEAVVVFTGADDASVLDLLTSLNRATGAVHFVRPTATSYQYVTLDRLTLQSRAAVATWTDEDFTQPFATSLQAYDLTDERIINFQRVEATPRLLDTEEVEIWQRDRLPVPASTTRTRWARFEEPAFHQELRYTVESGSATVAFTPFARSAKIQITAGAGGAVLRNLRIIGQRALEVELDAAISEDAASQTSYGTLKGDTIASDYISSEAYAEALGDWYVYRYKTPRAALSPTFVNRFPTQMVREIGDRVTFTAVEHSASAITCFIRSFETRVTQGNRHWETTYELEEAPVTATLFTLGGNATQGLGGTGILGY